MKNKRLLYILLPAVLVIWGLIFQRIWQAAQGEEELISAAGSESVTRTASTLTVQRPQLLLNYTDPFRASRLIALPAPAGPGGNISTRLGGYTRALAPAPLNLPVASVAAIAIPVAWPSVKYLGFINNPRLENRIALLTINDKEYSLKLGGNKEEITVSKIWRDSVQVVFKAHKKTVIRAATN